MVRLRPVWMTNRPPSVLWHCWLGHQTRKNRRPYNLYCVGADVKPCSINQSICQLLFIKVKLWRWNSKPTFACQTCTHTVLTGLICLAEPGMGLIYFTARWSSKVSTPSVYACFRKISYIVYAHIFCSCLLLRLVLCRPSDSINIDWENCLQSSV